MDPIHSGCFTEFRCSTQQTKNIAFALAIIATLTSLLLGILAYCNVDPFGGIGTLGTQALTYGSAGLLILSLALKTIDYLHNCTLPKEPDEILIPQEKPKERKDTPPQKLKLITASTQASDQVPRIPKELDRDIPKVKPRESEYRPPQKIGPSKNPIPQDKIPPKKFPLLEIIEKNEEMPISKWGSILEKKTFLEETPRLLELMINGAPKEKEEIQKDNPLKTKYTGEGIEEPGQLELIFNYLGKRLIHFNNNPHLKEKISETAIFQPTKRMLEDVCGVWQQLLTLSQKPLLNTSDLEQLQICSEALPNRSDDFYTRFPRMHANLQILIENISHKHAASDTNCNSLVHTFDLLMTKIEPKIDPDTIPHLDLILHLYYKQLCQDCIDLQSSSLSQIFGFIDGNILRLKETLKERIELDQNLPPTYKKLDQYTVTEALSKFEVTIRDLKEGVQASKQI